MSSPAPQAPASASTSSASTSSAPAHGRKKSPLILGAMLLVLGSGGYVGYAKFARKPEPSTSKAAPVEIDPGVIQLEPFILNLSDPAGDRYFRLNVRIVLDQKSAAARAASGLPQVKLRDRVLTLLSKQRAAQLATVAGKERLRGEIQSTVEALISEPNFYVGASSSGAASGGEGGGEGEGASKPEPEASAGASTRAAHVIDVFFTEFLVQ